MDVGKVATQNLVDHADRASASGDFLKAATLLEIACEGDADADVWLRLAAMRRAVRDEDGALLAVDGALRQEPLNFVALLLKATLLEKLDSPESDEHFGRAVAQRPPGPLAPQIQKLLDHAAVRYGAWQDELEEVLKLATDAIPLTPAAPLDRLTRFRTNITRKTRPFHSEPSDYHYPGLPEIEFYDRALFDWLDRLEESTDDITQEFQSVVAAERSELVPYVQYADGEPVRQWAQLNNSMNWSAIHLVRNGLPVLANTAYCPITMRLLASLPQPCIPGASPNAMFSLLAAGATIPPHTGVANTRLICHLPIIVPERCWFRVGAERRDWQRGVAWVFDDTIEHEAGNESAELRVVLIFDIWHPGLCAAERTAISAIIAAREGKNQSIFI